MLLLFNERRAANNLISGSVNVQQLRIWPENWSTSCFSLLLYLALGKFVLWEVAALKRLCQQGKLVSALSNVMIILVLWHKASYFVVPPMYVFIWDLGKEQVNK